MKTIKNFVFALALIASTPSGAKADSNPILLNVTYNYHTGEFTITNTGNNPMVSNSDYSSAAGVTLKEFFLTTPTDALELISVSDLKPAGTSAVFGLIATDGGSHLNIASTQDATMKFTTESPAFTGDALSEDLTTGNFSSELEHFRTADYQGEIAVSFSGSGYGPTLGDYTYTVVPEPSAYALMSVAGFVGLAALRARRQKR